MLKYWVTPEALPEAFAHITFDGEDEGYITVTQVDKADDSTNDGATKDIGPVEVTPVYADGAVGKALYLDGTYGLDLNLEATNTDTYTVIIAPHSRILNNFLFILSKILLFYVSLFNQQAECMGLTV